MKPIITHKDPYIHVRNWHETYQMARPFIVKGKVGIDVGCREGGFAREMEQDFSHIYGFDFRDKWRGDFYANVEDPKKFTYTAVAIGEKEGLTYTRSDRASRIKGTGDIEVPIRTIDSYNYEDVAFIKYDVEGYELKAVKGSEKTIKKYMPVIVVEQNKGNLDAVELLKEWGYECKGIDEMFKADYLMVKNEIS